MMKKSASIIIEVCNAAQGKCKEDLSVEELKIVEYYESLSDKEQSDIYLIAEAEQAVIGTMERFFSNDY